MLNFMVLLILLEQHILTNSSLGKYLSLQQSLLSTSGQFSTRSFQLNDGTDGRTDRGGGGGARRRRPDGRRRRPDGRQTGERTENV